MQSLRSPKAAWLVLAAVVAIGGALESAFSTVIDGGTGVPVALLVALCFTVAWWNPLAAVAALLAVTIGQAAIGNPLFDMGIPLYAIGGLIGRLAARETGRRFAAGAALGAASVGVVLYLGGDWLGNLLFAGGFLVVLPTLVGRAFRSRAHLNEQLREQARGLAEDRHARTAEAAAAERRRIAGELHDLVAHGVSGMVVQAGAARRLVSTGDPRASEAIRAVEDGGREALTELRRLLGVLRREDADLALAPQPSLARVAALVARLRESGRQVELRVTGEAPPLSPGLDVAGYRVVEEALRGAAGPVRVTVHYGAQSVDLAVEGAAPEAQALVGLRERVDMFGGELVVAARRGGTPALRARLPLRSPA